MKIASDANNKKYPKGYFVNLWMGLGIAIFSGVGIPIAIITDNFAFIGIGPALGVSVGLAIGQGMENKFDKEGRIRELTPEEKRKARRVLIAAFIILAVLFFTALGFFVYLH